MDLQVYHIQHNRKNCQCYSTTNRGIYPNCLYILSNYKKKNNNNACNVSAHLVQLNKI